MVAEILPDDIQKERALELLNTGQVERARELLATLCRSDQRDAEIWSLYGTANGYLGRFEDVITACTKVLEIDPESLPAQNNLASALSALGRHDEAAANFAALLRRAPGNPSVLNNYSRALVLMGRFEEAQRALEEAIRIQPYYAEARYNLATLLEQTGKAAEALREYEQAAELKPGLPKIGDRINKLREVVQGRLS